MTAKFFPMSQREAHNNFHTMQEQLMQQEHVLAQLSATLKDFDRSIEAKRAALSGFETELSEVKTQLQAFCAQINDLQLKIAEAFFQYKQDFQLQSEMNQNTLAKLDSICAAIFNKECPIDVRFEREYYKTFPTVPSDICPNFQHDFLKLMQHLDADSIKAITLALNRLSIVQRSSDEWIALYSEEEKRESRYIREHFFNTTIPLSATCFYCNGYLLPVNHFESCVFWDRCGLPYLNHPERFASLDIIDAGAFIGDSALVFSEITSGTVHSFEPVPENYDLMLKTIELNGRKNIVPKLAALGDQRGKLTISMSDSCSSHFKNEAISYHGQTEADMITLDDYVEEHSLKIGLIKADVEGAEQMLLRGALRTIKEQKPALLISIYHSADDFFHIKPMLEQLNLGYCFKVRHPVCGSVLTETLLIAETN